jgi:predicted enzyme related to lactoylglutathione lyase
MLRDAPVIAILPAVDIERAKQFYGETLGLPESDMPAPLDGALFEGGQGTMFYIYTRPEPTKAEHTVAGWMVDDVEAAVEDLHQRGVEFEQYDMPGLKTDERGIAEAEGTKSAWFKDTEGNIVSVFARPS